MTKREFVELNAATIVASYRHARHANVADFEANAVEDAGKLWDAIEKALPLVPPARVENKRGSDA